MEGYSKLLLNIERNLIQIEVHNKLIRSYNFNFKNSKKTFLGVR